MRQHAANGAYYELSRPDTVRRLAEWDDSVRLESVRYPVDPGHARVGKRLTDLSVLLTSRRIPDFVWTWYSDCLIQDHVLRFFRGQGFTGFDVKPCSGSHEDRARRPDLCDDNPGLRAGEAAQLEIPTLWELVVTGWAGVAPPESGVRLAKFCPACSHRVYSRFTSPTKLIDESQWDGSDFFMVWPLPRYTFITDRVAKAIRGNKLRGALLKPLSKLECKVSSLSPGRLSHWMPEDRARQLGEPFGIY